MSLAAEEAHLNAMRHEEEELKKVIEMSKQESAEA